MVIEALVLTGNILLVLGVGMAATWQLTDEGVVDGTFGDGSVGHMDSIWTMELPHRPLDYLIFSIRDQIVTVRWRGSVVFAYHMRTGELLEPAQIPPLEHDHDNYYPQDLMHSQHYLHHHQLNTPNTNSRNDWPVSQFTLQGGWVRDPEGRYRLWIPIEWRVSLNGGWFYNITAPHLNLPDSTIIVKF